MKYTWINGVFEDSGSAALKVNDLALQRGYGVFDFFRCMDGIPFLLPHYLERFYNSADTMGLGLTLKKEELSEIIAELISINEELNCGIKMTLTGGYSNDGYTPTTANLILSPQPISGPTKEKYLEGFKVMTNAHLREFPQVKTTNYMQGIYLIPELKARGLDDVLYFHKDIISEFPRSNFFMIDAESRIRTPNKNVLYGITRKCVISMAADFFPVTFGDISLQELFQAKEVFMTSTTKGVMPVCQIDGLVVNGGKPGPVTRHLMKMFENLRPDAIIKENTSS